MTTPDELAGFDQLAADIGETTPTMTWEIYSGFKRKGFNEVQAFTLTRDWLVALIGAQKRSME